MSNTVENSRKRRIALVTAVTFFVVSGQHCMLPVCAFSSSSTIIQHRTSQETTTGSFGLSYNLDKPRTFRNRQIQCFAAQRHGSDDVIVHQQQLPFFSSKFCKQITTSVTSALLVAALTFGGCTSAFAENELSAKYGNKGLDTSLVDQTCLINHCSLQAKACLQDDPSCRKGLTCTAKCLGDNACITGCMARYGNNNLDSLLKCTIEDNECIKIAILPGGADTYVDAPLSPAPTVQNFNVASMTGSWYKVIGYNPNYDCYACQRNTFTSVVASTANINMKKGSFNGPQQLQMDVEFSMPHLLPDGSPPPPTSIRESLRFVSNDVSTENADDTIQESTMLSIGLNDYKTRETMVFDQVNMNNNNKVSTTSTNGIETTLTFNKGSDNELNYHRTAHSEGEMFGLKFWENWYIIGENDQGSDEEFKFVYYNGKTRQNTYSGAFVYSRTKQLSDDSLRKVYEIATNAGMDPKQFCRIRNGCFVDEQQQPSQPNMMMEQQPFDGTTSGSGSTSNSFFRGMIASTRISEMLGVEPVEARDTIRSALPTAPELTPLSSLSISLSKRQDMSSSTVLSQKDQQQQRPWWNEVGDYLENPHRHFQVMDDLRSPMIWPK